jgi:hypothetical protein
MATGSLQETLEARAMKGKPLLAADVAGTNAQPQFTLGMVPATYSIPRADLNAAGWTNTQTGNVFITDAQSLPRPNIVAHEAYHARQVPTGGMPEPMYPTAGTARKTLALNMGVLQPPADKAGPHWGLEPNRSAEEQIANLRGYEGALPAGMPITASPIAERLFQPNILDAASRQDMVDYYFRQSSMPHQGVWEGQIREPTVRHSLAEATGGLVESTGVANPLTNALRRMLVKGLGMNVPMNIQAPTPTKKP